MAKKRWPPLPDARVHELTLDLRQGYPATLDEIRAMALEIQRLRTEDAPPRTPLSL